MKALLLAAGFGSRLGDISKITPKALVEINNVPIIEICINKLIEVGVKEIIVNSHHKANMIQDFFESRNFKAKITLTYENVLLGTAGTLKKQFESLADDDFFVMHSDNYFSENLVKMLESHKQRKNGKFGSMATFTTDSPQNCGVLTLDSSQRITGFYEKVENPPSDLANAAIYIFTNQIQENLFSIHEPFPDISKNLLPKIFPELNPYYIEGPFVDIGTPEGLALARSL